MIALVLLVVLVPVVLFLLRNTSAEKKTPTTHVKSAKIAEVTPAKAGKPAAEKPVAKKKKGPYDDLPPIPEGHDLRTPTPGLKTDAERKADFERRRELRLAKRPKPIFDNPTDSSIAMMLSADPSGSMPPIPTSNVSAEQYAEIVKSDIKIDPDDPPEVVQIKEKVNAARMEVINALAAGSTMGEIAAEVRENHNYLAELHADAKAEMNKIIESGDMALAKAYVEKVNKTLEQAGAPTLKLPSEERREQLRQMIQRRKGKQQ